MSTPPRIERVYGLHAVEAALRHRPRAIRSLAVQAGRRDRRMQELLALAANQGVAVDQRSRRDLDGLVSGRHQGCVAEVERDASADGNLWTESQLLQTLREATAPPLLLILDGVTDPHNLGACLRSADAAGATAVIIPRDRAADLGPTVSKVASGAAEVLPVVRVANLARCLRALREAGVWLYATAADAGQTLYELDLTGSVGLVLGSEGDGVRRLTREQCDGTVALPMAGTVSSLNVSVAAGVCLFEALRQRR